MGLFIQGLFIQGQFASWVLWSVGFIRVHFMKTSLKLGRSGRVGQSGQGQLLKSPPPLLLGILRTSWQILRKDFLIELRSRVLLNQILPFAVLVLTLFAFALDGDATTLEFFAPGLFWVAVLLAALLAVGRSFAVEQADSAMDNFRLAAVSPAAVFFGKALVIFAQLLVLQIVLALGVVVFYGAHLTEPLLFVATSLLATAGIASAGTLYGVVVSKLGVRETLLPLLLMPALVPILIGATRAFGDALGTAGVDGWQWLGLLGAFALAYLTLGALIFSSLLEEN